MSSNPVFRLRSSRDRASGTELPVSSGQRQSDGQDQDDSRRNDGSGNVGRRFAFARRDSSPSETAEGVRSLDTGVRFGSGETSTVGDVIRYWLRQGIQIIPAKRGDKFPSIKWQALSQAEQLDFTETLKIFEEVFSKTIDSTSEGVENAVERNFNYAILTGIPSGGLVVLDYDDRDRGLAHPVDTFTVETGKGLHYYIRVASDSPIGNASYRRAGLDIRGSGGIAIAPPSQHPSGALYRVVNPKPILEVTEEWFRSYLAEALAGTGENNNGERKPLGWFEEAFEEVCPQGGRDSTATSLVGYLLNFLHPNNVRAIMNVWAEAKCDPPLTIQDIDRIVSSLERKRKFDAVPTKSAEEPMDVPTGPEDEQFRGLGNPTRNHSA